MGEIQRFVGSFKADLKFVEIKYLCYQKIASLCCLLEQQHSSTKDAPAQRLLRERNSQGKGGRAQGVWEPSGFQGDEVLGSEKASGS